MNKRLAISAAAVAAGVATYVALRRGTETATLTWYVIPGATVTGLEQTDQLPPVWRNVAEFPVAPNGGSFTATVAVVNGQAYWRAYTR